MEVPLISPTASGSLRHVPFRSLQRLSDGQDMFCFSMSYKIDQIECTIRDTDDRDIPNIYASVAHDG